MRKRPLAIWSKTDVKSKIKITKKVKEQNSNKMEQKGDFFIFLGGCGLHFLQLYKCDKMEGETKWADVRADNEAWQNKQSNIPPRMHPEVINGNLIRCSAGCFAPAPDRPSPAG